MNRIVGIDPGLNRTGWGMIEVIGNSFRYIGSGVIITSPKEALSARFVEIYQELNKVIAEFKPSISAIEETYVNTNYKSSLKLAQARAIAMFALEKAGLNPVSYQAKQIKKAVSGYGSADKEQMIRMINLLLPQAKVANADAADAIAIAICHSSYSMWTALKIT